MLGVACGAPQVPVAATPDEGAVLTAGNFAGALVSEDYDEALSYLTLEAQAAVGGVGGLASTFGALCAAELDRYVVQMQTTQDAGFVVHTGTLTCADGEAISVLIVTENAGPSIWLVRDFRVSKMDSGG